MCVDCRNVITMKDKYPLPLIDDQIDKLGSHKYFTGPNLSRYISDKMEFKLGFIRIVNYLQLCSLFIWKGIWIRENQVIFQDVCASLRILYYKFYT